MGRTNKTYRNTLKNLKRELSDYKRALRKEDQELFEKMFDKAEKNADAASYQNPDNPVIIALLSILLQQEKEIKQLKEERQD